MRNGWVFVSISCVRKTESLGADFFAINVRYISQMALIQSPNYGETRSLAYDLYGFGRLLLSD